MMVLKITIYSHFFTVTEIQKRAEHCIMSFCKQYAVKQWVKEHGKAFLKITKVFAVRTKNFREFRFHIGQLPEFLKALKNDYINESMYTIETIPIYNASIINIQSKPNWVLRDYQQSAHDFIVDNSNDDNHSRLVAIQTGKGKSIIALMSAKTLSHRTLILVLSGYTDKWVEDVEKTLEMGKGDIVVVQGSKSLKDLTYSDTQAKFIIISLNTIKNWFKLYEEYPNEMEALGYAYPPDELCKQLDIGTIIIDEVHQHLHAVYKFLTYTHVPKVIALSATLISDDPMIKRIQHEMFPREIRFDNLEIDQYIRCYAMSYYFNDINKDKIRTTEFGSKNYSHNAFEKSILRRTHVTNNYLKLLNNLIRLSYIEHYKHGDRLAIFVSSIAMADIVTQYVKKQYPDMDVRRYVEQDPYENVIDADIRITTVLSAGTAVDIPNLTAVIMTINMKSSVFNLQTLGRLRKIPDRIVRFYWIFCNQITKHVEFHNHRKDLFRDKVESIKEFHYPNGI